MAYEQTFEDAWRKYLNGPSGYESHLRQEELLRGCTQAATTIGELVQIFNAATDAKGVVGVRPATLKKMIDLTQTLEDAKRVYSYASKRVSNRYLFPTLEPQAKAKLSSFASA